MPNPYANLVKLVSAVSLLSTRSGATIKALMDRLHLSKRSVFRLLEALNDLGFPMVDERHNLGGEKTYRLLETYVKKLPNLTLPGFSLTAQESFYLDALLDSGASLRDIEGDSLLSSLRTKLSALLPDLDDEPFYNSQTTPGDPTSPPGHAILDKLRKAIQHYRACVITFHSFNGGSSRSHIIHPLKVIDHRGGLYLYAQIPDHGSVRLLDIDRIESVTILETVIEHPSDIDAAALFASGFDLDSEELLSATIRFSPEASHRVRDRHIGIVHAIDDLPDGSCTYNLGTRDLRELLRWVLSFGSDAEIIAPPELRSMTRKSLKAALAKYDPIRSTKP